MTREHTILLYVVFAIIITAAYLNWRWYRLERWRKYDVMQGCLVKIKIRGRWHEGIVAIRTELGVWVQLCDGITRKVDISRVHPV